jgi:glycosyltransferase, family 2
MQQNKSPLVSVIIPTYNSARTLETTLKSVKDQTYPNIEMIVVDNQSKDTTRQIAEKYADAVYIK